MAESISPWLIREWVSTTKTELQAWHMHYVMGKKESLIQYINFVFEHISNWKNVLTNFLLCEEDDHSLYKQESKKNTILRFCLLSSSFANHSDHPRAPSSPILAPPLFQKCSKSLCLLLVVRYRGGANKLNSIYAWNSPVANSQCPVCHSNRHRLTNISTNPTSSWTKEEDLESMLSLSCVQKKRETISNVS